MNTIPAFQESINNLHGEQPKVYDLQKRINALLVQFGLPEDKIQGILSLAEKADKLAIETGAKLASLDLEIKVAKRLEDYSNQLAQIDKNTSLKIAEIMNGSNFSEDYNNKEAA